MSHYGTVGAASILTHTQIIPCKTALGGGVLRKSIKQKRNKPTRDRASRQLYASGGSADRTSNLRQRLHRRIHHVRNTQAEGERDHDQQPGGAGDLKPPIVMASNTMEPTIASIGFTWPVPGGEAIRIFIGSILRLSDGAPPLVPAAFRPREEWRHSVTSSFQPSRKWLQQ